MNTKKYNSTSKYITTNQLFIDDISSIDKTNNLQEILTPLNSMSEIVYAFKFIEEYQIKLLKTLQNSEKIIIPGGGGKITQNLITKTQNNKLLNEIAKKAIFIDVKRKILPGSLTPRGIEFSDKAKKELESLQNKNISILDDVIASGSTMNSLFKRLGVRNNSFKNTNINVFSIAGRKNNDLKITPDKVNIDIGYQIEKKGGGYPRINTLSTLVNNTPKSKLVKTGFIQNGIPETTYDTIIKQLKNILLP